MHKEPFNNPMSENLAYTDADYPRLVWRSRRGMLELDLICEPFVRQQFLHLDDELQQAYHALMTSEDPYLYSTLVLGKPCLPEHRAIVTYIRSFMRSKNQHG